MKKSPAQWAAEGSPYDCTGLIGQMDVSDNAPEWPMYSFDRPSSIVWNAIAAHLNSIGWTDAEIEEWLRSKKTRWALDGALGEMLRLTAEVYAQTLADKDKVTP